MSTEAETRATKPAAVWVIAAVVAVVAIGLAFVTWRGCGPVDPKAAAKRAEEEKKEKEEADKKKEVDPKIERVVIEPGEADAPLQSVKPGHWSTASQRMKAIYEDFIGESQVNLVNGQNEAYPVAGTPFVLRASRPVALVKGRSKDVEITFLVPQVDRSLQAATELAERGFGRTIRSSIGLLRMPSYQYHFVILAKEPNRYGFVKTLDSVEVPFDGESDADSTDDPVHYHVVALDVKRAIALPDNPLAWTSVAYILWDEVDPTLFTPEQERALVDWLNWGGQLVISGPDSLDLLKGSFLESLLPATSGGSRTIKAEDDALGELNEGWMIPAVRGTNQPLAPTVPWSGVKLDVRPDAHALALTGGLLVERPVGRGRIVVSAMQLAERDLVNWSRGFESLFNACILRRPRREYRPGNFGGLTLAWADPQWADHRLDAQLTTGLRYLARDLGVETNYHYVDVSDGAAGQNLFANVPDQQPIREYRPPEQVGGIGAWNDFSLTANAARESLVKAAGVEVPGTSFVIVSLALYLIALVPMNWLVFRALGRIEWAWVAAPVIAVAGTMVIVDRARLDIGFVRAQTEIGLLELQPDYARGHLARYTALYTSLSTTYDLDFDSLTAVAAPFPTNSNSAGLRDADRSTVDFQRYDKVRLAGVFVSSNSTNMVHSEQMFPLDGAIRLGKSIRGRAQIENRSKLYLMSAAVVERTTREEESRASGRAGLRGAWIGELRPGESAAVSFGPVAGKGKSPFEEERAAEERLQHAPRLNLEPTFSLALNVISFEPGEKRLVARVDEVLPGETVSPAASQVRGATLVVAHLEYASRPDPQRDRNTRKDVPKE